jgi:hypothetical protein
VKFGFLKAGEGFVEVLGRDTVRGREAWHTRFRVKGGVPMYRVDDVLESWIDTGCFQSLRFVQQLEERGKTRALDDGSFFFFVRTQNLVVGETYEYAQYFRPDRNPVVVRVIGRERVTVPAGTFDAIVLQPIIKTKGIFSDKGEARIWLTDDASRVMVKMTAKVAFRDADHVADVGARWRGAVARPCELTGTRIRPARQRITQHTTTIPQHTSFA